MAEDATCLSCCERDAVQRAAAERRLTTLKKTDLSVTQLHTRHNVIPDPLDTPSDEDSNFLEEMRNLRLAQLEQPVQSLGSSQPKLFRVDALSSGADVQEWLKEQRRVVVAHIFKKQNQIHRALLDAFLQKQSEMQYVEIQVTRRKLVSSCFALSAIPTVAVFTGARLVAVTPLHKVIQQNRLMKTELSDFLRPHVPYLLSEDEATEESGCVICGRDYPHEHVLPSTIDSDSSSASSDAE